MHSDSHDELPRISSIQNLVFGLPERRHGTVKALYQNIVACRRSPDKSCCKVDVGEILSRLLLKLLKDMQRNLGNRCPRGFGRFHDFSMILPKL